MKNKLLLLFLFIPCLGLPPFFAQNRAQPEDPYADVKRMERGVVKIRAEFDEGEEQKTYKTGAGFVLRKHLDRHYILTVTHLVKGADAIEITYRHQRRPYTAKVLNMQGAAPDGLALLLVSRQAPPGTSTIHLETKRTVRDILVFGFPANGKAWFPVRGKRTRTKAQEIRFNSTVGAGYAGGPVLGNFGHALGILTSTNDGAGKTTDAATIQKTVKDWGVQTGKPRPPLGREVSDPYDWSVHVQNLFARQLFMDHSGIFAVRTGKEEDLVFRLDADFRRIGKHSSGRIFRSLLLKDGRLVLLQRDVNSGQWSLVFLDQNARLTGKRIKIKHEFRRMIQLANGDILGLESEENIPKDEFHASIDQKEYERIVRRIRGIRVDLKTGAASPMTDYHDIRPEGIMGLLPAQDGGIFLAGALGDVIGSDDNMRVIRRMDAQGVVQGVTHSGRGLGHVFEMSAASNGNLITLQRIRPPYVEGGPQYRPEQLLVKAYDPTVSFKPLWERNIARAGAYLPLPGKLWVLADGHIVAICYDTLVKNQRNFSSWQAEQVSISFLDPGGKILWRKELFNTGIFLLLHELSSEKFLLGGDGFFFAMNRKGEFVVPYK